LNYQPEAQHPFSYPQARRPIIPSEEPRQSEGVVIQFSPDSARGLQMRGWFQDQGGMFSYIHPEKRIERSRFRGS
jgi:hypothetical protein